MELKPQIVVTSDILNPSYREFWDRKAFQKYMNELFNYAYASTMDSPIIKLSTRLVGSVDGHQIKSEVSDNGMKIFVSEDYNMQYGKPATTNRRTGREIILSKNTVIINRAGRQVYPPLSGRQKSELDKFIRNVFQTVYRVEKTK